MKKIKYFLIPIFTLALGGIGYVYYLYQTKYRIALPPDSITNPVITSTPTVNPGSKKTLPEDWEIYTSQKYGFQIGHPNEIEISSNPDDGVKLLLSGSTQAEASELTDGILLMVKSGAYDNENLKEFVESKVSSIKEEPITQNVSDIEEAKIDSLTGYKFNMSGFGQSTYYYFEKGSNKYLRVIEIVQDPTNQDYQEIVDQILITLTFI